MRDATAPGCDTYTEWLPLTSITVEPARLDITRWASGGIILSSVATKYQLGFVFQAGSLSDRPRHGQGAHARQDVARGRGGATWSAARRNGQDQDPARAAPPRERAGG